MFVQYIILVRHGSREKVYAKPRRVHKLENTDNKPRAPHGHRIADRSKPGRPASLSLAGWLAEALALRGIEVWHVLHSHHQHAKETAEAYLEALRPQELCRYNLLCKPDQRLDVETFWNDLEAHSRLKEQIIATPNGRALMICGHQPQLTWIAGAFLERPVPLPLRQSEAACLKIVPRPQLLWAISDYHQKTIDELKEKIKSKMNVAVFFAGFISLLLGVILGQIGWPMTRQDWPWVLFDYFGTASVLLAVALCVATTFAYDRLMMPTIFWAGEPRRIDEDPPTWTVQRPPSQTHWILYFSMVRIWKRLFIPAVVAFFAGLTCILIGLIEPPLVMMLALLAIPLLSWRAYCFLCPDLGFDD